MQNSEEKNSKSRSSNYVSVVLCHYSLPDDFGGTRARNQKETRSELLKITMDSLERNTDYPAEIIVMDNGGNPDDSNYLLDLTRRGIINTYVRFKNNMHFGWAWNQGVRLATSDLVCLTCNDIGFEKNWLSATVAPLFEYPDEKLIATPICTPDKDYDKYWRPNLGKYRRNTLAGSNCMILWKKDFYTIGEFSTYAAAGTFWQRKMHKDGYLMVLPPKNMVVHLAHKGGLNFYKEVKVKQTLLDNSEIDFSYGTEKCPGVNIKGQIGARDWSRWLSLPTHNSKSSK